MFKPQQVIFAPTGSCNLVCAHCRVPRDTGELSIDDALAFLDRCAEYGIERVGFSGGEPFLRPDFLEAAISSAVEHGMFFDRLMTNGDWWSSQAELDEVLGRVADAGFDGILGLSADAWHGQSPERLVAFLKTVFSAFGRRDCAEILSVRSPDDRAFFSTLDALATGLGGRLVLEAAEPARITDTAYERRRPSDPDDGSGLIIPIARFNVSPGADDTGAPSAASSASAAGPASPAWSAPSWFKDDYCEGPGNVFYVHPDGRVAPCCGFANERSQLVIGTVQDDIATLMANAVANPMVSACFEKGLGAVRARFESEGVRFPGKTSDMCFFCDYLCSKGLQV